MKKIIFPLFISLAFFLCVRLFCPSPHTLVHSFFESYGFKLSEIPIETVDVTLPDTFTPVYENYNRLQKQSNLDLTPYLGKTVKRYTYTVLNFPFETDSPVRANALVYQGKIIAADLMTVSSDGFMLSPADPIFSVEKR